MVFPELCITGYTCGDLFWQETLLKEAKSQLLRIAAETEDINGLILWGCRWNTRENFIMLRQR